MRARSTWRGVAAPVATGLIVAALAFAYGILATAGSGQETVFWGFLTLLCGIPFYVLTRWRSPG